MLKQTAGLLILLVAMSAALSGAPVCLDGVCTYEPEEGGELTVYLLACDCADKETVELLSDFFKITPVQALPESVPAGAFLIISGGECSAKKSAGFPRDHILTLKGKTVLFLEEAYPVSQKESLEKLKTAMKTN
jgi:hypothetical protein